MSDLRALAFDLQGTLVDFHRPVMRLGASVNAAKGLSIDWQRAAATWRRLYREAMDAIIAGCAPWRRVDAIYRRALDEMLEAEGVATRFSPGERDAMNAVWTRLDPWPDTVDGLRRLRPRYTLTTLSNAGMASAIALVKHAGLPFDAVLTAELAHSYKPAPEVYRLLVDYLDLPPSAILMVACHAYDLEAARAFGLRTAFVSRPLEFGPDGTPGEIDRDADIIARDLLDLAAQLDAAPR